jgi:DNA-binding response OmpR family regulator
MTDNKNGSYSLVDKKVLIIEDDTFFGGIVLRHLLDAKIRARMVSEGVGAIEAIKLDIPDILILDIMLPGISGLEILEAIRKDKTLSHLQVVVLSNSDKPSDLQTIRNI